MHQLFIATPTHICKRYCAKRFVDTTARYTRACDYHHIFCNSRASAREYYSGGDADYQDMQFGEEFYGKEDSIHRRIVGTMQALRERFLAGNIRWFLSLESDVMLGPNTIKDMFAAVNKYDANIIHANCYPGFNTATKPTMTERITMGCTLICREALEQIEFRYEPTLLGAFHDAFFGSDAMRAGFDTYYMPDIFVEHVHDDVGNRGWEQLPDSEK